MIRQREDQFDVNIQKHQESLDKFVKVKQQMLEIDPDFN